jgi:transposase
VQKVLEDANIKLGSVVSDVMGVSSREMLAQLIAGQDDPAVLAQLARGRMRSKIDALEHALTGHVQAQHQLMLRLHLDHIDELNTKIECLNEEIERQMAPFDQDHLVAHLDAVTGLDARVLQALIADLGTDMSRFPTAAHAVSWAGLAPGKNASAGRNRSARAPKGTRHLKALFVQAAQTLARSQDHYLGAPFRQGAARRGKKRAAVAVARSILVIVYHMIRQGTTSVDLGVDYVDTRHQAQTERRLIKRLEQLGHKVTLDPRAIA